MRIRRLRHNRRCSSESSFFLLSSETRFFLLQCLQPLIFSFHLQCLRPLVFLMPAAPAVSFCGFSHKTVRGLSEKHKRLSSGRTSTRLGRRRRTAFCLRTSAALSLDTASPPLAPYCGPVGRAKPSLKYRKLAGTPVRDNDSPRCSSSSLVWRLRPTTALFGPVPGATRCSGPAKPTLNIETARCYTCTR
eukprot:COSAG04_NODE_1354_length_7114_cov_2.593443_3_plen_190_part_00